MINVSVFKPTIKDYLIWFFRDVLFLSLVVKGVGFLLGIFVVAIALPWRVKRDPADTKFGIQYPGWEFIGLPQWARAFDNTEVGAMGDYTWPENYPSFLSKLKISLSHPIAMYVWLAWRNPANNLQRWFGQKVTPNIKIEYTGDIVVDSSEEIQTEGYHFVKCTSGDKTTYSFYLVKRYGKSNKCLRIRAGYKIKPDIDVDKKMKLDDRIGFTLVIAPYKTFG